MNSLAKIKSHAIKFLENDIDTDQIIPARFLKTSSLDGFGEFLFFDRRFIESHQENPDFPFSAMNYNNEKILIAGSNFGCGSSREHAPWALKDFGIQVIISRSFADIFYNNCLKNKLLPIIVDEADFQIICQYHEELSISLKDQEIKSSQWCISFLFDPFSRYCLLNDLDDLDFILQHEADISAFEICNSARIHTISGFNS